MQVITLSIFYKYG